MSDFSAVLPAVVKTVRSLAALGAQDPQFHRSIDSLAGTLVDELEGRFDQLVKQLALNVHAEDVDPEQEDTWKFQQDVLDSLFERLEHSFDELKGKKHLTDEEKATGNTAIAKPQLKFKTPIDNLELAPFKPLLKEKPHQMVPLATEMEPATDDVPAHWAQPYTYEIDHQKYPEAVVSTEQLPVTPPQPWNDTQAIWVDTTEKLEAMAAKLSKATEIAVDLEHHDMRSFYGLTCLMQISTRDQDWLVDTLALREELGPALQPVFADPEVLKVFHGAFMDIIWLQRDLGLYVVSLFDTFHALKRLGLAKNSLAYLLEHFADFSTLKKYQLADWRVRPLPPAMENYARADTHFLLAIYDQMRNRLAEIDAIPEVLHELRQVAKRRFEYPRFMPLEPKGVSSGVMSSHWGDPVDFLMGQFGVPFERKPVVARLYAWRTARAKQDDDSPRYVMPNPQLVAISNLRAPVTAADVLNLTRYPSEAVRTNALALAELVNEALENIKATHEANASEKRELAEDLARAAANIFAEYTLPTDLGLLVAKQPTPKTLIEIGAKRTISHDLSLELVDRFEAVRAKFAEQQQKEVPVAPEVIERVNRPVAQQLKEPEAQSASPEPRNEREEIIALRQPKRESQPVKPLRDAFTSDQDVVDFSTKDRVLDPSRIKPYENKKKRKFNPDGGEVEMPAAPAKRKAEALGRTGVFRK